MISGGLVLYDDTELQTKLLALGARVVTDDSGELIFEIPPHAVDVVADIMREELDALIASLGLEMAL